MSVLSHGSEYEDSGEGADLLAEPFSEGTGYGVHPASQVSEQEEGMPVPGQPHQSQPSPRHQTSATSGNHTMSMINRIRSDRDIPKHPDSSSNEHQDPLHNNPQDAAKSLCSDDGQSLNLLVSKPSQESLAQQAYHGHDVTSTTQQSDLTPRQEDLIKPLRSDDPRPNRSTGGRPLPAQLPQMVQSPLQQQQQQQQQLHLQQQYGQQFGASTSQNTPATPPRHPQQPGGGPQRSYVPGIRPPTYEDSVRQSPEGRSQGGPSPNQSPGSDVADLLGDHSTHVQGNPTFVTGDQNMHGHQTNFNGPIAGNVTIIEANNQDPNWQPLTNCGAMNISQIESSQGGKSFVIVHNNITINQPHFEGTGNPIAIGALQDSRYKGSNLTSGTARPGGAGQGGDTGPGGEEKDGFAAGLSKKQGLDEAEDPDVIIEEEYTEYAEDGVCDDNLGSPQSNSMTDIQSAPSYATTDFDHKASLAQDTSDQSASIPKLPFTNRKVPSTFDQLETRSSSTLANQKVAHTTEHPVSPTVHETPTQKASGTSDQSETAYSIPAANQQPSNTSHQSKARAAATLPNQPVGQVSGQPTTRIIAKALEPRDYQLELAKPANEGQNVIIIAPTGTGKSSAIAALICKEHLGQKQLQTTGATKDGKPKIAFIVPTVVLVEQLYQTLQEYLPHIDISKRTGATDAKQSIQCLMGSDILILTPMILVNAMVDKDVTLADFSMLVFDECHRAVKDSPYSKIMEVYLKQKMRNSLVKLPQIVGLTASPSIRGNTDKYRARDCIMELCANLDAHLIKTVQHNTTELQEYSHTPEKEITVAGRRQKDPFRERVECMMIEIEAKLSGGGPLPVAKKYRGEQRYKSYVEEIYRKALEGRRTDIQKYCKHLFEYNKVLQFLDLVRMRDALQVLEDYHKDLHRAQDDADEMLRTLYKKNISHLLQLCDEEDKFPNPKMETLKWGILKEHQRCLENQQEFRCMVFVEQRLLTTAIQDWMQKDEDLSALKPGVLTGARAGTDSGGMTKQQQDGVIQEFHSGNRKILISTSIGIEGLNIPSCNMVISYNYSMDEVKMIQFRGRARAEDSVEMSVGTGDKAIKYKTNLVVVAAVERAIEHVQTMLDFEEKVHTKQCDLVGKKEEKIENLQQRRRENSADDVQLLCLGCDEFACNASDIRLSGCNHINPDKSFAYYRLDIRPHHDKKKDERGIKKIYCKKCGKDWGNTFRSHPCLKIESFKCETKDGLRTFKKWKQVNFPIEKY